MPPKNKNNVNRSIVYLSLIGFFGIFSTTISKNPVLPYFSKSLGANDQLLGLIAAISPIAGIVFSFPVGILADKIGKRFMLIFSALVFLIAPLLYIFITDAWMLIPLRFFHGLSTAILGPVASAMIASEYSNSKGEKLGTYSSITLIGRTIAPLTGGFIITCFSLYGDLFSYKTVYIAAFIISIPVVLFSFKITTADGDSKKRMSIKDFFDSLRGVIRNRILFAIAIVDLSVYFSFGIFETFTPGYLKSIGYSARIVGLLFSIQILSIAITKPLFGMLADRIDKRVQIAVGLCITGLSIASLTFVSSFMVVTVICMFIGLGMSITTVTTSAFVADITKRDNLGASMGALSSIMDIGHSTGPFVAGIIISAQTVQTGYLTGTTLATVVLLIFFTIAAKPNKV